MGKTTAIRIYTETDTRIRAGSLCIVALLCACSGAEAPVAGPMPATGPQLDASTSGPDASTSGPQDAGEGVPGTAQALTYATDLEAVRSVDEAMAGVFIPPYVDCREPLDGVSGQGEDGKVCTPVSIAGCTEPGRYYPDYASCDVVRRQRPYWPAQPAGSAQATDPRLQDPEYMQELAWAREQVAASGCTCCHDSREISPSQWDISAEPIWIDTLSDTGLALFAGLADSVVLGAYPPEDNFGFSRDVTGIPTTDPARMQAFMLAELSRRGLSESWATDVPPFGGPIYTNSIQQPGECAAGEGVAPDDTVHWRGSDARYVYVQRVDASNPGVPPNLDAPEGTLWRLDVLASDPALASGLRYATTPPGSFQTLPASQPADTLVAGTRYKLVVLQDVGLPLANCLFTYGDPVPAPTATDAGASSQPSPEAGVTDAGEPLDAGEPSTPATCELEGGDERGFGAPCDDTTNHSDCPCEANYCSKSPFDAQGYCSKAVPSCDEAEDCPSGWGCIDVSVFQPGAPVLCSRP